ncbi:aldose epimerase family protein [Ruegeria sp. HKCCD8929]|uniref:aldose epimerase family protein n=1 Tax=Ruegeria sp. HKCCD8929 TaxID=2683006 RepID=UPI001488FACE|nr:aldose epimerase family protein [Ruegeria sp. HKCCD8929]
MSEGGIESATLISGDVSVTILSLGCITHDWRVPVAGELVPVVQSYAEPEDHRRFPETFKGVIAGRVANRTSGARFVMEGKTYRLDANDGVNHLHGGAGGLTRQFWRMERDGQRAVRLMLHSPHGDQGYPGAVDFEVTITLEGYRLSYDMRASPDRPTPINLAQHSYYNLMGTGDVLDHFLTLKASAITPVGQDMIPIGMIQSIGGTDLDFRGPERLGDAIARTGGIDTNFVFDDTDGPVANLSAPNGLRLRLWSDQPGLQLYSGRYLHPDGRPLEGQRHEPFAGVCLEPQHFPDALNQPGFPSIICTPEQPYVQSLSVEIAPEVE